MNTRKVCTAGACALVLGVGCLLFSQVAPKSGPAVNQESLIIEDFDDRGFENRPKPLPPRLRERTAWHLHAWHLPEDAYRHQPRNHRQHTHRCAGGQEWFDRLVLLTHTLIPPASAGPSEPAEIWNRPPFSSSKIAPKNRMAQPVLQRQTQDYRIRIAGGTASTQFRPKGTNRTMSYQPIENYASRKTGARVINPSVFRRTADQPFRDHLLLPERIELFGCGNTITNGRPSSFGHPDGSN